MFGKKVKTENGLYGIIGLGRFGYALAQTLSESGKDLIIIDENESKINSAAAFTDHAYVVQELSKENFRKVGIDNCDVVIICIGERIDTCILAVCWNCWGQKLFIRNGIWRFVWQIGCLHRAFWTLSR